MVGRRQGRGFSCIWALGGKDGAEAGAERGDWGLVGAQWDSFQLRAWLPLPLFPERLHGTVTRVIQADFTGGLEIYEAVKAGLKGLEIGVLGMSPSLLGGALPSNAHRLTLTGNPLWSPSLCSQPVSPGDCWSDINNFSLTQ